MNKLSRLQLPKLEKGGLTTWNHAVCCRETWTVSEDGITQSSPITAIGERAPHEAKKKVQLRAYIPSSGPTRSRVRRILRFLPEGFEFQCKHLHFVFSIFDEAHLSRLKFEQRQISMHAGKRISPRMRDESNSSKSESLSQICVDFLGNCRWHVQYPI